MSEIAKAGLLEKTELAFKGVRKSMLEAAKYLHECKETEVWTQKYSSFGEFVESGLGISQSAASKLIKAYSYWVLEVKATHADLVDIPTENLYLAIGLKGNDETKLEKARLLTRTELKEELAVKENGEEHDHEWIEICIRCHKRRV